MTNAATMPAAPATMTRRSLLNCLAMSIRSSAISSLSWAISSLVAGRS